jgi:hypothetical protein
LKRSTRREKCAVALGSARICNLELAFAFCGLRFAFHV